MNSRAKAMVAVEGLLAALLTIGALVFVLLLFSIPGASLWTRLTALAQGVTAIILILTAHGLWSSVLRRQEEGRKRPIFNSLALHTLPVLVSLLVGLYIVATVTVKGNPWAFIAWDLNRILLLPSAFFFIVWHGATTWVLYREARRG